MARKDYDLLVENRYLCLIFGMKRRVDSERAAR